MSNSVDLVDLNARLLALYVQVCSSSTPADVSDILADVIQIRGAFQPDLKPAAAAIFDRYLRLIHLKLDHDSQTRLDTLLTATTRVPPRPPPFVGHVDRLEPLTADGQPGISVVTCSMNRAENLIRAVPSWLANPEITEVVIVDWSSLQPVQHDLARAGITDPRIRILRVDAEPRWILSYAFNAGFRAAACDVILKVDADIVLAPDFFQRNHVGPGSFIAGNWRNVSEDQAFVNGFFFVSRKALQGVGGFNEHITTYGWDDDDIYDRMTLSGLRRRDVAPNTIFHLDHDDAARLGEADLTGSQTVGANLLSGIHFMIRRNRYLAAVMPQWDAGSIVLPFRVVSHSVNLVTVRRDGWVPSAVPSHIQTAARSHALTELLVWRLSRRVYELEPARIERLLARGNTAVSRIDVEVAITNTDHLAKGDGYYLVLDLKDDLLSGALHARDLATAFAALIHAAQTRGLTPVLRGPYAILPQNAPDCLTAIPMIPGWEPLGQIPRVTIKTLFADWPAKPGDFGIDLTFDVLSALGLSVPHLIQRRPKLYIDAQHGLGNRLRAIGSAAAIAAGSDRELVIVWQPDDHCDGHFSDLFDYQGAVIKEGFVTTASQTGCEIYNYMPNEAGSAKDALIRLDTTKDIYARAAFVLNNPKSTWDRENRFLQSLIPIAPVRALVNSVRHPNDLSAHIRMEAGAGLDQNTYDCPENWLAEDHALIHEWRAKSHFSRFVNRIDTLIAQGRAGRIFLAADLPGTYREIQHHYGDRLAWLPRNLYDRSAQQLHYALADAILLSRTPLLLGSTWSSFSELAMRLAPHAILIEMSGKDF